MGTISDLYDSPGVEGPKYRLVADAIRRAIATGKLGPGDKLPPVRELAWQLSITPGTVARAYTCLTDDGIATASVGRGTFVAEPGEGHHAHRDRHFAHDNPAGESDLVNLFSPRLPDMGQVELIHDAFAQLSGRPALDLLNYPTRTGYAPARRAALRWLADSDLGEVREKHVVLTHGGQSGVSLVMQAVLKGRWPVILVEELSYPGFRRAAELLRADVVAVPMDEHGIIPQALDEAASRHEAQLLCTSPEVHNPTGIVTPPERREEIAEVARLRGFHVLEDDCYRLSRASGPSYRKLLPGQGWHLSSVSKTLSPALRVGFAVAPDGLEGRLRRAAEHGYFGLARPLTDLTEDLLTRDETYRVLDGVRKEYQRYVRAAVEILDCPDLVWHEDIPFLWLPLPRGWRAGAFVRAAEAHGVQLRSADDFALRDGFAPHAVRLAVNAQVSLKSFEAAMWRLRRLLEDLPDQIEV